METQEATEATGVKCIVHIPSDINTWIRRYADAYLNAYRRQKAVRQENGKMTTKTIWEKPKEGMNKDVIVLYIMQIGLKAFQKEVLKLEKETE